MQPDRPSPRRSYLKEQRPGEFFTPVDYLVVEVIAAAGLKAGERAQECRAFLEAHGPRLLKEAFDAAVAMGAAVPPELQQAYDYAAEEVRKGA